MSLVYDLKHPFEYAEGRTCKGISIKRPKGKDAKKAFAVVSCLMPMQAGEGIPEDLAEKVLDFVNHFGEVAGDSQAPMPEISGHLDVTDIWELSGLIAENFM